MSIIIDNFDFYSFPAMKYWSPTKGANLKQILNNMIYSNEYCLSTKVDGNWLAIIKDMEGNLHTRARNESVNGGFPNKIGHIPHIAEDLSDLPNGTVLLGEIYLPLHEQSRAVTTILGCLEEKAVQRQEKGEKLAYYIFDCLAFNGQNISAEPLEKRVAAAAKIYNDYLVNSIYISMAKYIFDSEQMADYIAKELAAGREGVVLQRRDNPYEFGKRTARHTLKVKKEIAHDIDCFLTGRYREATWVYTGKNVEEWEYWHDIKENKKLFGNFFNEFYAGAAIEPITKLAYFGWAGAVEIGLYNKETDKIVPIGWISNVTEDIKREIVVNNPKWRYKVCKINAMMIEEDTQKLRHARIIEWRADGDKKWKDCGIEQLR